tara:strand:+ start:387 stop:521 length:135 start_codon:yes stop_codon:yes gene_type:complete
MKTFLYGLTLAAVIAGVTYLGYQNLYITSVERVKGPSLKVYSSD